MDSVIARITDFKKGELWWAYDKKSGKTRPVIVVQGETGRSYEHDVTVVKCFTIKDYHVMVESDFVLEDWYKFGCEFPTFVACSQIDTISKRHMNNRLYQLPEAITSIIMMKVIQYLTK